MAIRPYDTRPECFCALVSSRQKKEKEISLISQNSIYFVFCDLTPHLWCFKSGCILGRIDEKEQYY
jgi:hypothetical protein